MYINSELLGGSTFERTRDDGVFSSTGLCDRFLKGDKKVLRFQAKLRNVTNNDKTRDFVINYCELCSICTSYQAHAPAVVSNLRVTLLILTVGVIAAKKHQQKPTR